MPAGLFPHAFLLWFESCLCIPHRVHAYLSILFSGSEKGASKFGVQAPGRVSLLSPLYQVPCRFFAASTIIVVPRGKCGLSLAIFDHMVLLSSLLIFGGFSPLQSCQCFFAAVAPLLPGHFQPHGQLYQSPVL